MRTFNKELQQQITPLQALEILKEGNKRFISNLKMNRNLLQQVNDTRDGQWPFAVVLSCIDSRTSAELVFDQGLGDIFSIRIAGNIITDEILGSMEFGCNQAGAKIIVVLGHTRCGAIKGACDHARLGNLTKLIKKIEPAVAQEKFTLENRTSDNAEFVDNVARINVQMNVAQIIEQSPIIKEMVEQGQIAIIGAMYDVAIGQVEFYESTMLLKETEQISANVA